jgi:NADPH2:quinone reductase
VIALTGLGGYAQYASAPIEHSFTIPDGVDDGTALALLIQGTTAWHLYRTAGRVAEGESVVVHSAAGGAGRVIAVASSPEKRDLALELGADVAIDSDVEGLTERLLEANEGREVDLVFDMAGGEAFERSYRALAHFGRIVVCGISSRQPNHISSGSLLRHSRSLVGFYLFHCLERPGMFTEALPGRARANCGRTWAPHMPWSAQPRPTSTSPRGARPARSCSIPPLETNLTGSEAVAVCPRSVPQGLNQPRFSPRICPVWECAQEFGCGSRALST